MTPQAFRHLADELRDRLVGKPRERVPLGALLAAEDCPGWSCTRPWTQIELSTRRSTGPCCPDYQSEPRRAPDLDVESMWNGEAQRRFRRSMVAASPPGSAMLPPETCRATCPVWKGGSQRVERFVLAGGTRRFVDNQILVVEDILEGREIAKGTPLEIVFPPTTYCNYDCLMCEWGEMGTLEDELGDGFYASLAPYLPTLRSLEVNGGEPLASRPFRAFLAELDFGLYPDLKASLTTNGSYLTAGEQERLERVPFSTITLSLNAASAATYERVNRGLSFDRIRANLDALAERVRTGRLRARLVYSMVVLKQNRHEVRAFARLANEDGAAVRFMLPMFDRNGSSIMTSRAAMESVLADFEAVTADLAARGDAHRASLLRGEAEVLRDRLASSLFEPLPDGRASPEPLLSIGLRR